MSSSCMMDPILRSRGEFEDMFLTCGHTTGLPCHCQIQINKAFIFIVFTDIISMYLYGFVKENCPYTDAIIIMHLKTLYQDTS